MSGEEVLSGCAVESVRSEKSSECCSACYGSGPVGQSSDGEILSGESRV